MLRLYVKIRRYIIEHPAFALFFSHGGVHVVGALIMIALCVLFYSNSIQCQPIYKQIDVEISDNFGERASYIDLSIVCYSPIIEKKLGVNSGITAMIGHQPIDTSGYVKRYTKINSDAPLEPRYEKNDDGVYRGFSPGINPYIKDSSYVWRHTSISISTVNSTFGIYDYPTQGELAQPHNDSLFFTHIDTLRASKVMKSAYIDIGYKSDVCINHLTLWGNIICESSDNPYYNFSINIKDEYGDLNECAGIVELHFGDSTTQIPTSPLHIMQCTPSTYTYSPKGGIRFPIEDVINNGGIYFLAEDLGKKAKADRKVYINSVMFGASLAFLLDIIINLIIKWRNIAKRKNPSLKNKA